MVDYTNRKPQTYTFQVRYKVNTWAEVLVGICQDLYRAYPTEFEKRALTLTGRKRKYFSKDRKELWQPKLIPGSKIYVSTHFSSNRTMKRICHALLDRFGYPREALQVKHVLPEEVAEPV